MIFELNSTVGIIKGLRKPEFVFEKRNQKNPVLH